MGFALGGSFVFGLYGPQATAQHVSNAGKHNAADQDAKSKKEETDETLAYYTLWLMVFTGILAVATVGLGGATLGLYFASEKQIRHNLETAAAQSRDMERALIAANRPWIRVEIQVAGPVVFNVNGANITLSYVMKNIGRSPATHVMANPRLIAPILAGDRSRNFDPLAELRRQIADEKNRPFMNLGNSIFPDEAITQEITVSMSQDEIREATQAINAIFPTVIGTVRYRIGFDEAVHQTGFIVEVRRSNVPRPATIAKNRSAADIWVDEGDVPSGDVRLFRSIIDGGYAD